MNKLILAAVVVAGSMTAVAANAAYTLTTTNGGDGSVAAGPAPYTFTITGANNGVGSSLTSYTDVASGALTITASYSYTTNDVDGAAFDPAGYTINGALFQLSPGSSASGYTQTGTVSFSVLAGDTYGFYVNSTDSILGTGTLSIGAVPEPATWALMIGGFGMTGFAMRRRKVALAA